MLALLTNPAVDGVALSSQSRKHECTPLRFMKLLSRHAPQSSAHAPLLSIQLELSLLQSGSLSGLCLTLQKHPSVPNPTDPAPSSQNFSSPLPSTLSIHPGGQLDYSLVWNTSSNSRANGVHLPQTDKQCLSTGASVHGSARCRSSQFIFQKLSEWIILP